MRQTHPRTTPGRKALTATSYAGAILFSLFAASSTETAVANGDTRTLNLYHSHTGESIQATFRVNGVYDPAVLHKLNWFLRDWRNNDETKMDPRLFDVIWEVYRTAGATHPVVVFSAYRSPETNAMLRRRSRAVAEFSQHMLGKAMDTTMPGMSMEKIREIGMRLQRGGVGYYPRENFVHLDVGNVRYWPRMGYMQLARVFPDGKSVDLAADGRALPHYQEARAEIASRGDAFTAEAAAQPRSGGNLFGWLFGNHDHDEEADATHEPAPRQRATQVASLDKSAAAKQDAPVASKANVASVAPAPVADKAAAPDDADGSTDSLLKGKALAMLTPMPPSRPAGLVASTDDPARADVPMPPLRPEKLTEVAALTPQGAPEAAQASESPASESPVSESDAQGPLARAASLPVVITQGPRDHQTSQLPSSALGYANGPQLSPSMVDLDPNGPAPARIVAARLDQSNFGELTSETPTASSPTESILGQAVTGLRRAARYIPDALSAWPSAGYVAVFGAASDLLDSAHFTRRAAAPGGVAIVDATPPRQN